MSMMSRLSRSGRTTLALWSVPLAVVLFFAINIITSLRLDEARLDLTEEGLYTVSESTRNVLEAVEEPITLRLFRSSALVEEVPELRVYSERVAEMLRTYERLSDGAVRVERVDPIPFSTAEDKAIGYNLVGFNLSRAGEQGYFGLVGTNSVDQLEIIDVLSPVRENYLEYELTRMVMRLSNPIEPRIGVIDGLGVFGDFETRRPPAAVIDRLGDDFVLVALDQDLTQLPENLHALVVIHPHAMTESANYAVEQFALGGNPVVVFVDPLAERSPANPSNPMQPLHPNSSLEPLFAAWGVSFASDQVVGDVNMALSIRAQSGNQIAMTKYPPWLVVNNENLRDDDPVTSRLSIMRISSAGAFEALPGATTRFSPLVETTPSTDFFDRATLLRRDDPRQLLDSFRSTETVRTLAARITGPAESAFPDGPPVPLEGETAPHRERSVDSINVIVVGDTDMLANDHNLNRDNVKTTQNMDFLINAIDSLAGGGALYELRARGLSFRPFTLVNEIEAAAQARYRETEQQLQVELREAQDRLAQLRVTAADGQVMALTPEQQQAVADFNRRIVDIRNELRQVQAALRQDVEALTIWLRVLNILAVPALIVLVGIAFAIWRRVRLARFVRSRARLVEG